MSVQGLDDVLVRLKRLGEAGEREARVAVQSSIEKVRSDAVRSIQKGPKSGRVYERGSGSNLSATHQASASGQPPATDSGNLAGSGRTHQSGAQGTVYFDAAYAYHLEFGTMRMAPRPFLMPAVESNNGYIIARFERALDRAQKQVGR